MRNLSWMIAMAVVAALTLPAAAAMAADAADRAPAAADQQPWARWQGRLLLGTQRAPWQPAYSSSAMRLGSVSLFGDYYFSRSLVGPLQLGGFRATSGLIYGPRSVLGSAPSSGGAFSIGSRPGVASAAALPSDVPNDSATVPYLGVGYSNLSVRSGWSFSADLGLVGQNSGTARLGRALYAGQSLDDAVRDLRMAPLLQLGVSYSF